MDESLSNALACLQVFPYLRQSGQGVFCVSPVPVPPHALELFYMLLI